MGFQRVWKEHVSRRRDWGRQAGLARVRRGQKSDLPAEESLLRRKGRSGRVVRVGSNYSGMGSEVGNREAFERIALGCHVLKVVV